jgi:hypothetical protein
MLLTSKLVDEVHYNERGNEVFLVKHLDKIKERSAARSGRPARSACYHSGQGRLGI